MFVEPGNVYEVVESEESNRWWADVKNRKKRKKHYTTFSKRTTEIWRRFGMELYYKHFKSGRSYDASRLRLMLDDETACLHDENGDTIFVPSSCILHLPDLEPNQQELETKLSPFLDSIPNFTLSVDEHSRVLILFVGPEDKEVISAALKKGEVVFKDIHCRRKILKVGNVSVPQLPISSDVKSDVEQKIADGDILMGREIPPLSVKQVLIPGPEIVDADRILIVFAQTTEEKVHFTFPEAISVHVDGKNKFLVYFPTSDDVKHYVDDKHKAPAGFVFQPMYFPKTGGIIGDLQDVVLSILEQDYEKLVFSPGKIIRVKGIFWYDAKYSGGSEKSYLRFAIFSPIFPQNRSSFGRFAEVYGHESAFMREDIASDIVSQAENLCRISPPNPPNFPH
eukprot:Lithocolla_globosa_v1_NODE_403_length_4161_cov_23.135899.p2 type:complete len:395 gc:universal NODE_403_length_4161_cov_23.135899:660-1844(+)